MKNWYVAYTQPGGEDKAMFNLRRQGFEAYLPKISTTRRHARRVDRVRRPLFPRYLFVRMNLSAERWRAIHSTIGVTHLICNGDTPVPMPEMVIEEIRARESQDGVVKLFDAARFHAGDAVRVTDGPLLDRMGLFESMGSENRVVILLNILGRELKVGLPEEFVAACA
jgi:transcriptional antiterminator RfaH